MSEEKKKLDPLADLKPAAYVHVGSVLALLGVVWYMFGVLYALGGLVLATMFWIYWINQQKERRRAALIEEAIRAKRQQTFNAPPPEMMGEPPRREENGYE